MISFIVCSVNDNYLDELIESIKYTCTAAYEVIIIDNKVDKLSLTDAYNKGSAKANFPHLIFLHEDIKFLNIGWNASLISILSNEEIGITGVAGSTYLPIVPSGWYLPKEEFNKVFIHQGFKYKEAPLRFDNHGNDLTPVFLLDGVFLAMRKEVWLEFPFNEKLDGFHAYDVDICQRVSTKYQNIFTNQIELIHYSEGKVDQVYFDALLHYKTQYLDFNYSKRNYSLELSILKQFYLNLRCYYDKTICIEKIKPFKTMKILGFRSYFSFIKFLWNEK
jgi:hypothetical protein